MERLIHSRLTTGKTLALGRNICTRCLDRCLLRKGNINKNNEGEKLKRTFHLLRHQHRNSLGYISGITKGDQIKLQRNFSREFRAFCGILHRSGFCTQEDLSRLLYNQHRCFSTSRISCNRERGREQDQDDEEEKKKKDEEDNKMISPWTTIFLLITMGFALLSFGFMTLAYEERENTVSWNTFQHAMLAKGEVKEIVLQPLAEEAWIYVHKGAVINNKLVDHNKVFRIKIADPYKFEEKLRKTETELGITSENFVPIVYRSQTPEALLMFTVIVLGLTYLLLRNTKIKFPSGMDMVSGVTKAKFIRVDRASRNPAKRIMFKDVAGLKEAKVEVMEFVDYLNNPQKYKALGGKIPKGALLLGPPGCGKTLLAKAVAAEAGVPFLAMAGSEFVEMLGGLGASRVRDLFKEARSCAPCIIYVDEIDAIGRKRGGQIDFGSGEEEQTLNQLLVELDGIGTTEGVIMLASTNRADVLDKALLRPGRFDRHITIDLPTVSERLETFQMYLKKLKLADSVQTYAPRLAQMTPGMSGADIANVCNEAALYAARKQHKSVGAEDFDYAVERVVAGIEKKTGVLTPTEKKVVAYHEAGHALVGWMLEHTDALLRISIVPRTNNTLGFAQYVPSDQKLYSTDELFERMCMALGGRAAEAVVFNHVTTGAQDDLQRVTKLAFQQIKSFGMSEQIGPLSFPDEGEGLGTKPYSKKLAAVMDQEAKALVGRAYRHAEKILVENKEKLHTLATTLLEKEVITYEEVEDLIGVPPHGKKKTIDPVWIPADNTNDNSKPRKRRR